MEADGFKWKGIGLNGSGWIKMEGTDLNGRGWVKMTGDEFE